MIKPECFTKDWCEQVAQRLNYNDTQLIEKVIRALSLLEMLVQSECPFLFKGGTATMLLLGEVTNRLSIDIDIICPPGTNIEQYLSEFKKFGFTKIDLVERDSPGKYIPKSHSKFFYQLSYTDKGKQEGYILLDVLYEYCHYQKTLDIPITSPFIKIEGDPLKVRVPSIDDILGDKLTAFAPNTTGIPYYKKNRICSVEIIKQLYDVARLFDRIDNLDIASKSFHSIVEVEMAYRAISDLEAVYDDIIQTSLLIATRGQEGVGAFDILQDGIKKIKPFIHTSKYHIENAIVDSSKAAYIATCIKHGITSIEKYNGNPEIVKDMAIAPILTNKLNKLKRTLPEGFYYWVKTSELLQKTD
jgi:predicted nucleotidyltransferase component of viral defense system